MGGFGHHAITGPGFCMDAWGSGPFEITVSDRLFIFEDSDRFGPFTLDKRGNVLDRQPGEKSLFWKGYTAWRKQGRKVEADGKTCVFEPLKPTIVRRIRGNQVEVVEEGDEGGDLIFQKTQGENDA